MRILVLIWALQCIYQTASLKTLKKSLYYPDSKLIFSYTDERLLYAYCPKDHYDDQIECKVVREKIPYQNDSYVCNVKLKVEKPGNILGSIIKLKSFGIDKAIILWSESEPRGNTAKHVKLSTVELSSCKTVETKVAINKTHGDPTSEVTVVDYDDRFDIFLDNSRFCGEIKKCRVKVGVGRGVGGQEINHCGVIEKPEVKLRSNDLLVPIDKMSPEKGLFHLNFHNRTFLYSIIRSDGVEKRFATYKTDTPVAGISTAHETVGVCYTMNGSNVHCTQHDVKGKLKFDTTLNGFKSVRRIEAVHNLAIGGLLFLARPCEGPNCSNIVVKIDSNGRNIGSLEVGKYGCGFSWGYGQKGVFYENESNEYCASFACYGTVGRNGLRHEGRLKLLAKCFLDNNFQH